VHLFLSPHFDDAVYSCGGTLHQLRQQGERVHVITVMAGDPPDPLPSSPIVNELHARWNTPTDATAVRRAEDVAAMRLLDVEYTHLSWPDCIYRTDVDGTPLYPTEAQLWDFVHHRDPAQNLTLPESLVTQATHIYAPLAVGAHTDHLIVREAAFKLSQRMTNPPPIWFYADFPYLEKGGDLIRALRSHPAFPHIRVDNPENVYLTEADIAAKIEGVKAYQSQISTFWADVSELKSRVTAALTLRSPAPTEQYYTLNTRG
jgi:LmbE family N-acetylglucosaminyl deacetylase